MSWQAVHLDDLERGDAVEEGAWFRVRRHFGIEAFGINVWRQDAGKRVIEDHDETGWTAGRHEELYFVVSGRARFTVDGEDVDVPAGTFVHVPDPATKRGAIAEEDGTTVLVVGGIRGEAFRVSPWEASAPAWDAYAAKDYERAAALFGDAVARYPEAAGLIYNRGCCNALAGHREEALADLTQAIAIDERFRELARKDDDFEPLRGDEEFEALVAAAPGS